MSVGGLTNKSEVIGNTEITNIVHGNVHRKIEVGSNATKSLTVAKDLNLTTTTKGTVRKNESSNMVIRNRRTKDNYEDTIDIDGDAKAKKSVLGDIESTTSTQGGAKKSCMIKKDYKLDMDIGGGSTITNKVDKDSTSSENIKGNQRAIVAVRGNSSFELNAGSGKCKMTYHGDYNQRVEANNYTREHNVKKYNQTIRADKMRQVVILGDDKYKLKTVKAKFGKGKRDKEILVLVRTGNQKNREM